MEPRLLTETISIRMATPDDTYSITRLALLDSSAPPEGPLLLAERDSCLQAALSLSEGTTIADPFVPTAELVSLLRVRANRLRDGVPLLTRVRAAISSRKQRRAYAA